MLNGSLSNLQSQSLVIQLSRVNTRLMVFPWATDCVWVTAAGAVLIPGNKNKNMVSVIVLNKYIFMT